MESRILKIWTVQWESVYQMLNRLRKEKLEQAIKILSPQKQIKQKGTRSAESSYRQFNEVQKIYKVSVDNF